MGFFRQGYWSGLPFPPPGDLSDPGIEPESFVSLVLQRFFTDEPAIREALLSPGIFISTRKKREVGFQYVCSSFCIG